METKQYIKFFNFGYFLSKYEPKFLKKLLNTTENVTEINEPLSAGKSQFVKEQVQEKLMSLKDPEKEDLDKEIEPNI